MYRITLNEQQYKAFKKDVKHILIDREMSIKDLADMTTYSESAIRGFLSKRNSKFIAFAIAEALEIKTWERR